MALATFLRLNTTSQASAAIDNESFKLYKNGVELDKTGFSFTGFNTSSTPENAVFTVDFGKEVDFDEYAFSVLSHLGDITALDLLISNDGVSYFVIDTQNSIAKGSNRFLLPVAPVEPVTATSIDALINDALVYVKTYVDTKDAALKVYADDLISQLMNSTDLSAKLALINEINQILDGDAATAGFQLWESNVAKLNKVVADLVAETSARSSEIGATSNSLQTMINTTATEINARIDLINSGLSGSISTSVATLNTNVTANFVAMKSKAAVIFAV